MPKNEFDPEDPLELRGVGFLTEEDTSEPMTECFVEEFLRLGYDAHQVLALFRNRHYTGMHMVLQNCGESFVKAKISEVFGWWKRPVHWGEPSEATPPSDASGSRSPGAAEAAKEIEEPRSARPLKDPMGNSIPSPD